MVLSGGGQYEAQVHLPPNNTLQRTAGARIVLGEATAQRQRARCR
jgi:hypothetical protein